MQEAANAELADHIAGKLGDRRPKHLVEIDWDSSGQWVDVTSVVREVSVKRSLTGDLPEDAGLIDGYTSASLTATLEGTWVGPDGTEWPIAAAFSPFVPGSLRDGRRLVKARIRCSMGMVLDGGPKMIPQFQGPLRVVDGQEGDGTVKLQGVDPSERLRAPITLPTYAEFITHAARRKWALTINTQWVVDFILRACGIFASPPPRDEAIIVATGHGGLAAERGFNGAPISLYGTGPKAGLWTEDGHPWKMLGTPENSSGGTVGYMEYYGVTDGLNPPFKLAAGQGVGLSCWLHHSNKMGLPAALENRLFQIRPANIVAKNSDNEYPRLFVSGFGNGDIYVGLTTASGAVYATPRIPTGSSPWRFFGCHFQYTSNTTLVVRVRMDGQTRTYTLTVPAVSPAYRPVLQVNGQMFRAWTNLQVWPVYTPPAAGPWQGESHVSQADIGRGLNELTHLPDVVGAEAWPLLKEVVAAEFGVHAFAEAGRYSFRPRTDVRPASVDVELDVRTNLKDAKWSTDTDSVRNVVTAVTKSAYHSGKFQAVVKADDALQFVCPPGISRFTLDWPYGAAGIRGGVIVYYRTDGVKDDPVFAEWSSDVAQGFTYSYGSNWSGEQNVNDVRVTYCQIDSRTVLLIVNNITSASRTVRLATDADVSDLEGKPGDPALNIGGWPVVDGVEHAEEVRASQAKIDDDLGERTLQLSANQWRHRPDAVRPVMLQLLNALSEEITVIEGLEVIGDPRLQVGDVAGCRFTGTSLRIVGTIVDTEPSAADDGQTTLVSIRPLPVASLAPPGWSFYVDISRFQGDRADPIDLGRVKAAGYAGCVVKVGQGSGTYVDDKGVTQTLGAFIDPWWERFRDQAGSLWPRTFAAYWYVGNTESAQSQAERCYAALGDNDIPVMLDWEKGSGSWQNLLDVLAAMRSVGVRVTLLYTNLQGYAGAQGASNIDATGLGLVNSRYWLDSKAYPAQNPSAVFADILANNPTFGRVTAYGGTVDALQFTDAGLVYAGMAIDVNAFPGDENALAALLNGE